MPLLVVERATSDKGFMFRKTMKNDKILNHFLVDFFSILASILDAMFLKNPSQDGERVKVNPSFFIFASCCRFGVPPGSDLVDVGSILAPILFDFRTILRWF